MNHDEADFKKKLQKFSVVKMCPKCKHLSLSAGDGFIHCSNCGYQEQITTVR